MRILVTGGSSGIGRAIVEDCLAQGHDVIGLSRRLSDIEHKALQWHRLDLTEPAAIGEIVDAIPALDAVVHAAGIMRVARLGEIGPDRDNRMWRLHVDAPTELIDALIAASHPLRRIVLIGSRTMSGAAGKSVYAASKAAQQGLIRSWAMELIEKGCTANLVAPGATDTPFLHDTGRSAVPPRCPPLGRFVYPGEVAASVRYLLSEDAAAMTGQTLTLCGGASL